MAKPHLLESGLQTLLERATVERDQAMSALARALDGARHLGAQAEQLRTYRTEYQQRWMAQFRQWAAIEVVASCQHFLGRLDQALEQLRLQALGAEREASRARALLLARETHLASIRKLIERRVADHQLQLARREQRQTDETAANAARGFSNPYSTNLRDLR